mmetsp:Transcript_37475/g.122591  ORF Transcript_37475/g.122591 Transcript_37475/m.122591 type:complete len:212 (-) Transcript_37475:1079-1714(-)
MQRTTFGRWGTSALAGLAASCTMTGSEGETRRTSSTWTTRTSSRCGTWSLCSSTARRAGCSALCPQSRSTRAWASSGSSPSCKTCAPTTTPTSSPPSLRRSRPSPAPRRTEAPSPPTPPRCCLAQPSAAIRRTVSSQTTSEPSPPPSPTAPSPPTRGAATSCAASCAALCGTAARCLVRRRASSPSWCPPRWARSPPPSPSSQSSRTTCRP